MKQNRKQNRLVKRSISFAGCFNIYNGNYHSVFSWCFLLTYRLERCGHEN